MFSETRSEPCSCRHLRTDDSWRNSWPGRSVSLITPGGLPYIIGSPLFVVCCVHTAGGFPFSLAPTATTLPPEGRGAPVLWGTGTPGAAPPTQDRLLPARGSLLTDAEHRPELYHQRRKAYEHLDELERLIDDEEAAARRLESEGSCAKATLKRMDKEREERAERKRARASA